MPTQLYLDTARLGLMGPRVQGACRDFARFCGDEGASAAAERFLRRGAEDRSDEVRVRYPGLADWRGLEAFERSLCDLVAAPPGAQVLTAQRSAQLMRLTARAIALRCGRVLYTDLEWPGYVAILLSGLQRLGREAIRVPVRQAILQDGLSAEDLARMLAEHYRRRGCDGLFLSDVSFEGFRLPARGLVEILSHREPPRLVVLDGAQAIAHTPPDLGSCDIYLAGCHKWLGAGNPTGLALWPRRRSQGFLRTTYDQMVATGELDDPLLLFTRQLQGEALESFGETVGLAGLFSCAAAVTEHGDRDEGRLRLEARVANARALAAAMAGTGWRPLSPAPSLRSGILLAQAEGPEVRSAPPGRIRAAFQRRGIALTTYDGGLARLSMPAAPWEADALDRIRSGFQLCC
ncbi:aminotransferase class V-fold PLP-dependent enzyme [Tautonia sociabilis]|uniref:Aminotransferase class V-fold PLP-dependent enzyme n=1 Tax=Tautonia sociabilis TaxID=2080755 RepID=A0A432MKN3_9BACT|nr:hypothetical protein [Tautonia sociabilis]RUL87984.1 hypothetical protein TsocGM_09690 [Tautonia sociabilis]